jgi:hypothetical protein
MPNSRTEKAAALMRDFAQRSGLESGRQPRRYLWTDAFAVCNFLGLAQATGNDSYLELALRLVDQVHHRLGQHRPDDPRSGWISGLSQHEGELHPTRGGLRIGKELPERGPEEDLDERLEWDRDGQYFHYLTQWMHALDQVARATAQPRYNLWARELAETAFDAFTFLPRSADGRRRMYWKMSIDLQRALVPAMGQQDPLDGYVTLAELLFTSTELSATDNGPNLADEIGQFAAMLETAEWATSDPLGIGGLLIDAHRVDWLLRHGAVTDPQLLENLLTAALAGLQHYVASGDLRLPCAYRLAFRELGLATGLQAAQLIGHASASTPRPVATTTGIHARLRALEDYASLRDEIESFWLDPEHRRASSWSDHRDINEVMLATSLAPDGFLSKRALSTAQR